MNILWKIYKKSIVEKAVIISLGILLIGIYLCNLSNIYTLWQMDDEGTYMFNASVLAGYDWKETFSNVTLYYGYGYSLLLVPLFWICPTGLALIRGCIVINIMCIGGIYFGQIYLISKIYNMRKYIIALISFSVCFYSYLASNAMIVVCEVFLYFWYFITAIALYKAIKEKKMICYFLFAFVVAFLFFIHARSFVVISVIWILMFFLLQKRVIDKKFFFVFLIIFITIFLLLYIIKKYYIGFLGTGRVALRKDTEIGNLISGQEILNRIKWLFSKENILKYVYCSIGKFFYISVSTAGTFLFGIYKIIKELKLGFKNKKYNIRDIIKVFFLLSSVLMYVVCCLSGVGTTYAYMMYGRYYEYCIIPIIIIGIIYLIETTSGREICIVSMITAIAGIATQKLTLYAESENIIVDTFRISGITSAIVRNNNFTSTVCYLVAILSICCMLYIVICKIKWKKIMIPLLLLIYFGVNSYEAISTINGVNQACASDLEISNYIEENINYEKIYFLYESYRYDSFYRRMQVFIKNYPMHIIFPEEIDGIEEGSFLITYRNSKVIQKSEEKEKYTLLSESTHYKLLKK